jgi:hypothetical protein
MAVCRLDRAPETLNHIGAFKLSAPRQFLKDPIATYLDNTIAIRDIRRSIRVRNVLNVRDRGYPNEYGDGVAKLVAAGRRWIIQSRDGSGRVCRTQVIDVSVPGIRGEKPPRPVRREWDGRTFETRRFQRLRARRTSMNGFRENNPDCQRVAVGGRAGGTYLHRHVH